MASRAAATTGQKIAPAHVVLGLLLVMVVIGVMYYFFVYTEKDKEIEGLSAQINQLNLRVAELEDTRRNLVAVQEKAKQIETRLAQLQARLPSTVEDLNEFLSDISQRKQNARIEQWIRYTPQNPVPMGEINKVPISMNFIATYDAASEFFWELSAMGEGLKTGGKEQIVNVGSIKVERKQELGKGLVNVSCVVETYLYTGEAPTPQESRADRRRRRR